jgi:hypothetical protein
VRWICEWYPWVVRRFPWRSAITNIKTVGHNCRMVFSKTCENLQLQKIDVGRVAHQCANARIRRMNASVYCAIDQCINAMECNRLRQIAVIDTYNHLYRTPAPAICPHKAQPSRRYVDVRSALQRLAELGSLLSPPANMAHNHCDHDQQHEI